jgi:transcriptional regulator with XRE-family HTH domain
MEMKKKRDLSAGEKLCAQRAKSLYEKSGKTQEDIGYELGMTQSAVTQYLNGHIPMNFGIKISLAKCFAVPITAIDPELEDILHLSQDEQALLRSYRQADDTGKALTLGVAERSARK